MRQSSYIKLAVFHPKAREVIRSFPEDIRKEVGKAILDVQTGEHLSMPLSKPMPSVGSGVSELRLKDREGAYRVFYVANMEKAVIVFHAFVKKTQKTPRKEIVLGQKRLKEMLYEEN